MKKNIGIIVSIVVNVLLLAGMIGIHLYDVGHCSKSVNNCVDPVEVEKSNTIVCSKDAEVDVESEISSLVTRLELEYREDGSVSQMLFGTLAKYDDDSIYQAVLEKKDELGKYKELGDNTLYLYTELDTTYKLEDGTESNIWYVNITNSYEKDGFVCK